MHTSTADATHNKNKNTRGKVKFSAVHLSQSIKTIMKVTFVLRFMDEYSPPAVCTAEVSTIKPAENGLKKTQEKIKCGELEW